MPEFGRFPKNFVKDGLKIDNLEEDVQLYQAIRGYFELLRDYVYKNNSLSFVHSREYF